MKKKVEELEKIVKVLRDLQVDEPSGQLSKTTADEIKA